MKEGRNYARFYALLKKLPGADKEQLVYQHSGGRTTSLRELSSFEYDVLCINMDKIANHRLKTWRSNVLALLNNMGIIGWSRIDALCLDPRIAGKVFSHLDVEELEKLNRKLRSIQAKGGITQKVKSDGVSVCYTFMFNNKIKN